jgi:hypothetical protein
LPSKKVIEALEKGRLAESWIALANAIPAHARTPGEIVEDALELGVEQKERIRQRSKALTQIIFRLKGTVLEGCLPKEPEQWGLEHLMFYELLHWVRIALGEIVKRAGSDFSFELAPPISLGKVYADSTGTLHHDEGQLALFYRHFCQFLEGLNVNKVRKCPAAKCQNLFWMKRKDQPACTKVCANRLRQSQFYKRKKGLSTEKRQR